MRARAFTVSSEMCLMTIFCLAASATAQRAADQPVASFSLKDYRGTEHSLADLHSDKLLVIGFLGTECPLAKLYAPRLAELSKKYEPRGVKFVGINSNSQDSITEIAAYTRRHGIEFPVLKDLGNVVADELNAERTPEIFVLDASSVVRYHGRVDDQFGIGYQRDDPTRHDLQEALDELLAGEPVTIAQTETVGCQIGRIRVAKTDAEVTYSNQIARILQNRCVECHREGEIAPFALADYDEVLGWAGMIEEVVRENRMPPWHADPKHGQFRNNRALTALEREQIFQWVADGAPQGDSQQLPAQREFVSGWQLPRDPDVILKINERPYRVPAHGDVEYQYFHVPSGFTEDKWVRAAQILPGNNRVVHHILAFARPPGQDGVGARGGAGGYLFAYVPGLVAEPFPDGMAKHIPAGSELIFQVHYTPTGSEQLDTSQIGFVFADPQTITHQVRSFSAVQPNLRIPPYDDSYEVSAVSERDLGGSILLSMMPHMHLRGKAYQYVALLPEGETEILLNVPNYDFNWQTSYLLANPRELTAGTQIKGIAQFDNSESNLSNPDPSRTVPWGEQTWDEMMIGYFDVAEKVDPAHPLPTVSSYDLRPSPEEQAKRLFARFDANGDGKVTRDELPARSQRAFPSLDLNADGELTLPELEQALSRRR